MQQGWRRGGIVPHLPVEMPCNAIRAAQHHGRWRARKGGKACLKTARLLDPLSGSEGAFDREPIRTARSAMVADPDGRHPLHRRLRLLPFAASAVSPDDLARVRHGGGRGLSRCGHRACVGIEEASLARRFTWLLIQASVRTGSCAVRRYRKGRAERGSIRRHAQRSEGSRLLNQSI